MYYHPHWKSSINLHCTAGSGLSPRGYGCNFWDGVIGCVFERVGVKPELLNQMMCYIIKILNSSPVGSFSSETESIISPSYDISDIISQSLKEVVLIFNFFTLKAACV